MAAIPTALGTATELTEHRRCLLLPVRVSASPEFSEEELGPFTVPGCLIFSINSSTQVVPA